MHKPNPQEEIILILMDPASSNDGPGTLLWVDYLWLGRGFHSATRHQVGKVLSTSIARELFLLGHAKYAAGRGGSVSYEVATFLEDYADPYFPSNPFHIPLELLHNAVKVAMMVTKEST